MENNLFRVPEVAAILGCGRTTVYALMDSGQLRSVQVRSCRRIAPADLEAFLDRQREKDQIKRGIGEAG